MNLPVPMLRDPFSGVDIPTTLNANLQWRADITRQCKTSAERRNMIRSTCAKSPLFWMSFACWTFHQRWVGLDGVERPVTGKAAIQPFIPWPLTIRVVNDLYECIATGTDCLIRKSRDMGATWNVLLLFQWFFEYRDNATFMHISANSDKVDKRGNMDSIFEKHRWVMRYEPDFLQPANIRDVKGMLERQGSGSVIVGDTTTSRAGKGGRKTALHCDEFAEFGSAGAKIDAGTTDSALCRIFNSTPMGPQTHYRKIRIDFEQGRRQGKIIQMPWWEHPMKGKDAEQIYDPVKRTSVWTSPYYRLQASIRSAKDIAVNLDMNDDESGNMFFDVQEIDQHKFRNGRDLIMRGNLQIPDGITDDRKREILHRGDVHLVQYKTDMSVKPWRFWQPLIEDKEGLLRPAQTGRYILSADISAGVGSSNSVIDVLECSSSMIVAKFWDSYTPPERLAEIFCFAAMWFGGRNWPLLIWEKNGIPGAIFGKRVMELKYPNVYFAYVEDERTRKKTKKWGWWSDKTTKPQVLGEYRQALKNDAVINPCIEALDEAKAYVMRDDLLFCATSSEDDGGYATHGDHVIADALALKGRNESGAKQLKPVVLHGSMEHRKLVRKRLEVLARDRAENEGW